MIGGVGAGAIGAVGAAGRGVLGGGRDHAENDGAHSLAVDLSTGMDDDEVGGVIGLEEEQLVGKVPGEEGREMIKGQKTVEAVVGWLQSIGGTSSGRTIAQLVEQNRREETNNIVTVLVPPAFYGTVYHNSAIIIFAVLATRVLTLLHMGWAWIVVLLTICSSVYTISMERTRARARDDIARELTKVRLVDETESADWINNLLDRAWLIAEPLLGGESPL
jgi:Ca2+-dependent lipid-binding protein